MVSKMFISIFIVVGLSFLRNSELAKIIIFTRGQHVLFKIGSPYLLSDGRELKLVKKRACISYLTNL